MSLSISRVLHAGYLFRSDSTRLLFDPLFESPFSVNCYAYPAVEFDLEAIRTERFDAVFISHYHDDHCSFVSLDFIDRETPIFIYCIFEELLVLLGELGFKNVHSIILNEPIRIGSIEVIPRLALDADVDSAYEIHSRGLKVLNVVDSWLDPSTVERLERAGPWDVVLWPFQTMRELAVLSPRRADPAVATLPPEWLEQIQRLKPRVIVPSSCQFRFENWSWMNHAMFPIRYSQFAKEVDEQNPETQVLRLEPGSTLEVCREQIRRGDSLKWIRVTEAEVDYDFGPAQPIPTTAEIAAKLTPLSVKQLERVLDFCREEIPRRLLALAAPTEGYFAKLRIWRLSLFEEGCEHRFQFQIDGCQIVSADSSLSPEWTTEIPAVKLLSALEEGEALTSLYVRINDQPFSAELEVELSDADLLEDPLLRCLYEGVFASYQRAQLRRITDGPKTRNEDEIRL
jgi:hypothetical protein